MIFLCLVAVAAIPMGPGEMPIEMQQLFEKVSGAALDLTPVSAEFSKLKLANTHYQQLFADEIQVQPSTKFTLKSLTRDYFSKSEKSLVNDELKKAQYLTYQAHYSDMQVNARNIAYLQNIEPIQITSQNVQNHMFWEMSRLAGINRGTVYLASKDPGNSVWIDLIRQKEKEAERKILKTAYAQRFKLSTQEVESITTWTDLHILALSERLTDALKKIDPFLGVVVRNTNLDSSTSKALADAYTRNKPLHMSSLIKETTFISNRHDSILATVAAGNPLYNANVHSSRLVIYSRNGRLVAPLSLFSGEVEVVLHSQLSPNGFNVLGFGKTKADHGNVISVWFLEEIE